ncbi:GntR family transcriptional regulator [Mycolicibacterium sp. S2-37]|uniref:GntR family transcriptional regulator n=1 Tax=Mycolicibacterium sp. S2-37 TaxID=2810297 RepID=UPI001A948AEF|nr:GntR family transcriptional regulator [Mycolicibacterium sp. S2-37]MBO0681032.1 GntR family transcriptional regulator [Mycolicibacterium sp. S2-37]
MPPRRPSALLSRLAGHRTGTSQQAILADLRRVILDGGVPPGTTIPVNEVAELFGVSTIPIRESLKTLTAEGLVAHHLNVGYSVAQLTAGELAEMYLVRETLESAALAAAVHRATDADRQHVSDVHAVLETAVRDDDSHTYHRQSRAFHLGLTRPAGMLRLLHMLETAWNITEPVQLMVHVEPAQRALLQSDHQRMLDAYLKSDAEALLHASAEHNRRLNTVVTSLPAGTGLVAHDPAE